jgi:DHA2 family multidrug resistance protein
VLTSYLVSNAIILPVGAWASSVIGRRNFFLLCITIFTVASFHRQRRETGLETGS